MVKVKRENDFDFYEVALKELMKVNCGRKIIPFPLVFNRLGVIFHFDKETSVFVLKILENKRWVKLIPFHGIRILRNRK